MSTIENKDATVYVRIGDRLVFDYERLACRCGQPSGIHPDTKHQLPTELQEKGITANTWLQWLTELDDIQSTVRSQMEYLALGCFPGLWFQLLAMICCCPISRPNLCDWLPCCMGHWHQALHDWLEKINGPLGVHGMHAKFVTYRPIFDAPRSKFFEERTQGKNPREYEMSFLVISLTQSETNILQEESWDHMVSAKWCISLQGRVI